MVIVLTLLAVWLAAAGLVVILGLAVGWLIHWLVPGIDFSFCAIVGTLAVWGAADMLMRFMGVMGSAPWLLQTGQGHPLEEDDEEDEEVDLDMEVQRLAELIAPRRPGRPRRPWAPKGDKPNRRRGE
jgi:hypothetical protein